jgi:hypothetical protein
MKRGRVILSLVISTIILFITFSPINANAGNKGQTGVGVFSAPPQYSIIRLVQQGDDIRVYITVSDINSWKDIYSVSIVLEDLDVEKAEFLYKQYEDETDWEIINEFSEKSKENNLLVTKKCSYDHSDKEEILTGCYLNILFVFHTTWFTRLNIIASDRGGATSTLQLDYTSEDLMRRGDIIIIPALDESMAVEIPPYLLDIIALIIAAIGTRYVVKKTDVGKIMRVIYEKS